MDDYQPLFLKADDAVSSYMLSRITDSPLFRGKYLTAHTVSRHSFLHKEPEST